MSRRVQALERQLGAPLFERTREGLRLTSAGEVLLPHAERARAAELDALRAVADHRDHASGTVRLGIVGSLAGPWLTNALDVARVTHPGIDLAVSTATSREIRDQLLRGDITLGASYLRPQDDDLDVTILFDEELVVVCRPDHPLAGRRVSSFDQLRGERWLVVAAAENHPESASSIARAILARHQVADHHMRPIDSLTGQRALVQAAYGLAFLPRTTVADAIAGAVLDTIDVAGTPVVAPVTLMTRSHGYLEPAARTMMSLLKGLDSDLVDPPGRRSRGR